MGYVEGRLGGEKLTLTNECFRSRGFRKLHLELVDTPSGLGVFHCVMFPDPAFPLPIFGMDIVVGQRRTSLMIVDLSPVTADGELPPAYADALAALPRAPFHEHRELPAWGSIFSKHCIFVRPAGEAEEQRFLDRVDAMLALHCDLARAAQPASGSEAAELLAAQRRYCLAQQQNEGTRRVLARAFGPEWADDYMRTVLFDVPFP